MADVDEQRNGRWESRNERTESSQQHLSISKLLPEYDKPIAATTAAVIGLAVNPTIHIAWIMNNISLISSSNSCPNLQPTTTSIKSSAALSSCCNDCGICSSKIEFGF